MAVYFSPLQRHSIKAFVMNIYLRNFVQDHHIQSILVSFNAARSALSNDYNLYIKHLARSKWSKKQGKRGVSSKILPMKLCNTINKDKKVQDITNFIINKTILICSLSILSERITSNKDNKTGQKSLIKNELV